MALLVMLFNQVALAEHLCRVAPGQFGTATHHAAQITAVAMRCHGMARGHDVPDASQIACSAHCDDAAKQVRDTAAPWVPALIGLGSEVALLRPADSAREPDRPARGANALRDRPGGLHRVLLI